MYMNKCGGYVGKWQKG